MIQFRLLTYPEESRDEDIWTVTSLSADGDGEVPREEGKPAHKEGTHHHTKGHKGLKHRKMVRSYPRAVSQEAKLFILQKSGLLGHWRANTSSIGKVTLCSFRQVALRTDLLSWEPHK